jgi:hypothetical protein
MSHVLSVPSVEAMNFKTLPWGLILGLGALALIRPILRMSGVADDIGPAVGAVGATALITAIWVLVVGLSRTPQPVLTLVATGVTYAVLAVALSAIASPLIDGELRGPLTNPLALVAVVAINAVWGLLAGALAVGLQRATGRSASTTNSGGPR